MTSEDVQDGVGDPDAFQRLWSRTGVVLKSRATVVAELGMVPFCRHTDAARAEGLSCPGMLVYAVLNLYPYNAGHLMIVPYRHIGDYTELTVDEAAELSVLTQQALRTLRSASGAQGFNMGFNLGAVAGAGIAAHLHQHVVPRWGGDTNMMPIVGHTRVLPQLLQDPRTMLAQAWPT